MAMAAVLNNRLRGNNFMLCLFTLTPSGSYATGGDVVDFTPKAGMTNKQPIAVMIRGKAGFGYEYDLTNKKVLVRSGVGAHTHLENTAGIYAQNATTGAVNSTLGTISEIAAAAYPAAVTGDTIQAWVIFA